MGTKKTGTVFGKFDTNIICSEYIVHNEVDAEMQYAGGYIRGLS